MTKEKNSGSVSSTREMEMLLAWYVAGSLEPEQNEQLERYLAELPEAASRLENITEEMEAAIASNDALEGPSGDILERFLARIDTDESVVRAPDRLGLLEWLRTSIPAFDMPVGWLVAAAIAMAIFAQAAVIGILITGPNDSPVYETASGPTRAAATDEKHLLIAFTDQATASEITKLLGEIGGSMVNGPKAGGFYTVKVSSATLDSKSIEEIVTTLRGRTGLIRFIATAK